LNRLTLLGGVLLTGPDGPVSGRASQQKRLARLALVASAGETGQSRDRLIALLWPDSDTREARHHLSHSLYVLRAELGEDTLRTAGEYVRIDPSHLQVDSMAFEEALGRADPETAVGSYSGPFMDGFFVGSSEEFDRWVESERGRLASLLARTVEDLAREADDRGEPAVSARWWGRLVEHDPYNSAAVVGLMEALAAGGDPANAVQFAREHAELLERELGIDPTPEVQQLVESLIQPAKRTAFAARPARQLQDGAKRPGGVQVPSPARRIPRGLLSGAAATAVLVGLWAAMSSRESASALIPNAVMVRPIENLSGDPALDELGRYATYVLSGALAEIDTIRVVSADEVERILAAIERNERLAGPDLSRELRQQTRTALVLESSLYLRADTVLLESRLIDAESAEVLDGMSASAARHDPTAGVLALRDRVLVSVATRLRLGDQYSPSFGRGISYEAWQQLNAARELWILGGSERQALDLLYRAIENDSTFDAALGLAMIWHVNFGEFAPADSIATELDRRIALLPPRQRWQLAVQKAVIRRDGVEMVRAFRDWKDRLPNASRYLHLAWALSLTQRPRECLAILDSVDLRGSRYARTGELWRKRADCHHALGEYRQGLEQAQEGRLRLPHDLDLVFYEAQGLAAVGRSDAALHLIDESLSEPAAGETFQHDRRFRLLVDAALEMRAHEDPDAATEALDRAVSWYEERTHRETATEADRWRYARALYAAGRWEDARAAFSGLSADELAGEPTLLGHNIDVSLLGYQGTLAARLGDSVAADSIDNRLATLERPWLWGHAAYWRSAMAATSGDSAAATERLSEAMNLGLFADQWGGEYPKWDFHVDPDFESVRDYRPFRELTGPRD
jgi:DNA-binding SARP family transcriptional activator/TolB-like protein